MSGRSLYRAADDDPVLRAIDQQFNFREAAYREIDRLVASGIERGAAIRWIEDVNRMKRGALLAWLDKQ
jgi:hypothetical protein